MSKFKKKKEGGIPAINTAALPDIVFMLLFFFMVVTVLRNDSLLVQNTLPKGDQVEKLKKDRSMFIYAGKPGLGYENFGTEGIIQIGDKITSIDAIQPALAAIRETKNEDLKDKVVVALKVDGETHTGLVSDIKQELREAQLYKILYITAPGNQLDN